LLGECKWGGHQIGCGTLRELVEEKTTKVLAELPHPPHDWTVHHVFFTRVGFSSSAQQYAQEQNMILVNLNALEAGLNPPNAIT